MKKIERKKIIIFIILFVILFIVICAGVQIIKEEKEKKKKLEEQQQKKEQVVQYTKVTDFNSIEEVLIYLDSEFINQYNSEEENLDYVVEAKLKYEVKYEYKNYYEKLIEYSAEASKYKNFYIIDKEKNIEILVICNGNNAISKYYINKEEFYLDKLQNNENIKNIQKTETIKINKYCEILEKAISKKWNITGNDLGTAESTYKGYNIYFDEGFEVRKINNKIFNLIFTEKYKENVVESLKVNSDKSNIEKTLGKPEFETNNCIGYKTEKFYIFFSKNAISIYPTYEYSSDEIIKIIEQFWENKENTDIIKLFNEIKQKWPDYDTYKTNGNTIILQYTLKGILFKYGSNSTNKIEIYNNYTGKIDQEFTLKDVIDKTVDLPRNMNFVNEDLVFKEELNRLYTLDDYTEKDNYTNKNILNISKKFKAVYNSEEQQLYFVSINKEYANSELREAYNYGIWANDTKFIYSVTGRGIYVYNAQECNYKTLVEGKDEFKLIKIENNTLYYDNSKIEL